MKDARPVALYLTRNLVVGGAERVFLNYVNHAATVSPVVALLERTGGLVGELSADVPCFARVDANAERAPALDTAPPAESVARLALECLWLDRLITRTGAAAVSSFLMRAHVVALMTRIMLRRRIPLVLNIHEHMTGTARFFYPRAYDRALMRWIARHLFPRADRIVVVAEELKRDLVASFGIPASMIDVIHNPVDITSIRAAAAEPLDARPPAPSGRRTIVTAGRLVHLKGHDLLLRAVAMLRPAHDVEVVILGGGDGRAALERLATELGLQDVVSFVGEQLNPWRFIGRADVLALTSRTEAFPCVLTEAMALGVPVLATDCPGGVRECLLHDSAPCGLIVPPEDPRAIASGLDRLLRDAALRATLVARGLERVARFDLPVARDRYESMLTGAIASRSV